jgi:DNA-directed RNA polymerase subunit RPC12/RpoP
MEFNIAKQKIICKNCSTELDLPPSERTVQEHDFNETRGRERNAAQYEYENSVTVLVCQNCGAEISAAANVTNLTCRFCGSPQMAKSPKEAGIAPEALMPFRVQKHDAAGIFSKWLKKRFWAPKALKTLAQTDKLNAVYTPYWTFDAHAQGNYTAEGGKDRKETYQQDGKTETRTHTDWYNAYGFVDQSFDDVLVYAGSGGDNLPDKMKTFDTKTTLIPFESAYLNGFQAETYSLPPEEGFDRARIKMESEIKTGVEREVRRSYDRVRNVRLMVNFSGVMYKYVLLPLWFSGFTYQGKNFSVTINGATGEIIGAYPKSGLKIAIFVAACLAAVGIIIALIISANS